MKQLLSRKDLVPITAKWAVKNLGLDQLSWMRKHFDGR